MAPPIKKLFTSSFIRIVIGIFVKIDYGALDGSSSRVVQGMERTLYRGKIWFGRFESKAVGIARSRIGEITFCLAHLRAAWTNGAADDGVKLTPIFLHTPGKMMGCHNRIYPKPLSVISVTMVSTAGPPS